MSGQAELSQRFARLKEISGIMTAMKSLSLVETRKLARFIGHQRRMLANIQAAAADFLSFFPVANVGGKQPAILLLIGSERGFCGNFNERVLAALEALPIEQPAPALLVVGHRLGVKLETHPGVIARLDGPTMTEDVPSVLNRLMDALHMVSRQLSGDGAALFSLAHEAEGEPALKRLLPFDPPHAPHFAHPPRLQLAPPEFFSELLDQYLLGALYGLLYESLAAENRQRLAHMEHALDRLDETIASLALKRNALRQEKIVEEIEVILSSQQAFAEEK
ncbi:putative ATP synthase F1, gamma subunit (plasmid) [Sulfuricella denitrificans skB26]|uniref:Putative ATP synthase F1, gamma subunit n=1 Tax=Sulfuricella denitrificans (strain DSM 22764 / NBRC 105220 / skB26) TaxID=1163617 RepID=S6ABM0_SULDS|nr:FoF1 ATP synthase subunit gamma [Sulfuricella denitrificans]BAN36865.1 putative ATP synthase F1, gamma subunit [Sulfuricella denitrificans skB26]